MVEHEKCGRPKLLYSLELLGFSPLLQPLLNTGLFALQAWFVVFLALQAFGQVFLHFCGRWPLGIINLHVFVEIVGVFVVFAVVEVFHQLRGRVADVQGNGIVACILYIFHYAAIGHFQSMFWDEWAKNRAREYNSIVMQAGGI